MRVGIVAPSELQSFWEQHLRKFHSIREVVMVSQSDALSEVDACLYGATSADPVQEVIDLLKQSVHVFWLLPLPQSVTIANRLIRIAEESKATIQFVCWPVHTPALQKMMQLLPHPDRFIIDRKLPHNDFISSGLNINQLYRDEIAFCCFWVNHSLYDVSAAHLPGRDSHSAISLLDLHFANGSLATIRVDTTSKSIEHERIASDNRILLRHNIAENRISRIDHLSDGHIRISPEQFTDQVPAQLALSSFFRSISKPTYRIFDSYELKRYCSVIEALERKRQR